MKTRGTMGMVTREEICWVGVSALCHPCSVGYACYVAPRCPHLVLPLKLAQLPCVVGSQEFCAHILCPHSCIWVRGALTAQGAPLSIQTRTCFKYRRMAMVFLGNTNDQGALSYPSFSPSCCFSVLTSHLQRKWWHEKKEKETTTQVPFL